jgi:Ca2+-binding RTX toxin-like protein/methionine-rich copper-binding protein CopC
MRHHLFKSGVRRRPSRSRTAAVTAGALVALGLTPVMVSPAQGVVAPVGQSFTVTKSDLSFILAQIRIAERHAATLSPGNPCGTLVGTGADQIPSPLVSRGLRTVDGSCNNLQPGQETFGSADQVFPRIASKSFRQAEERSPLGAPGLSSYTQKSGNVVDSEPRTISNLIVDQTSTNPAAVAAAGNPVRSQGGDPLVPCTTDPDPLAQPDPVVEVPAGCVPTGQTLFIPNVTTDVGLSPPYNSMFTLFGQFFDHGVDQTVKGGGTVFVPLKADDPLRTVGPDHKADTGDEVPANQAFMVLTRAQNQPGDDDVLGTADDVQDADNTDSPWVDQSQTYTSHSSHQVFLREYVNDSAGRPVSTGKLLGGLPAGETYVGSPDGRDGISTWASVKKQAHDLLGVKLTDMDVLNVPMLAADPYGQFIPGTNGLPQFVTETGLVPAQLDDPATPADETAEVPANVRHFDTPFLTDIAHNADPSPRDTDNNPVTPAVVPTPDPDDTPSADFAHQPANTYDDEMLDAHFACGDGRCNENIGLSTIHQIFHSEHDRLVDDISNTLDDNPELLAAYQAGHSFGADDEDISFGFGSRLFQAARFVTEMEYQHLVFEEFARKVQPAINPFEPFAFTQTELNPAIKAEFAHAVYRFGHSMLTDTISRRNEDMPGPDTVFGTADDRRGSQNDISLLDGFLNPPAYFDGGTAGTLTPKEAAGSIIMGMSDQTGNELDEFVTETLRNNLLGLPLDLASINMARARSEGIPRLNVFRREVFKATNDGAMTPYVNWIDFGEHLKHPESLVNFVAAYGQHPSIEDAMTLEGKRAAAQAIVDGTAPGAADFMNSVGSWANNGTSSITGLDDVDLWVGGLAEVTNVFGGLLGSTFNYVFENQLTDLQNGDRLYYLARTPGMNLRTQLEGNSFAEMIMRNTNAHSLKADAFATADCKFELKNLDGTAAGFTASGNTVADDPDSECDETAVLLRQPDGTIKYRARNTVDPSGINGQSVYNGTAGVDRVFGGNDSDTFWGGLGNDVIEGGDGADIALGGEGDDIITDLNGDDVPKGGPGNDAIDAGPGLDIVMGGEGKDFTNGGANANETFGGDGDDFIMLGESLDAAFGDSGDDYEEGGNQPDLMQGDSGNLFFLDDSQAPGSDILVGQGGDDDYDMEGGDDIGLGGPGIEKVAGASGYDWEIGLGDPQPQDLDLAIPLIPLDILQVGVRDKFNEVEALSGGDLDDTIRGDDVVPSQVGGGGFIGCDVLDQKGLDRIDGLDALVPTLTTPLADVVATSASRDCPILDGPVWGDGNILLGGAGSDLIEGRGADDIIDGDRYLNIRLSVRNDAGDEIGSASVNQANQSAMTSQYLRDANGALTGPTLQEAVFAGTVNPRNIAAVREIKTAPAGSAADTALFSGARTDYTVTTADDGTITVTDTTGTDGTDTVRNVELLKFADQTVDLRVTVPGAPVIGAASAGPGGQEATVTWSEPASNGGSPINFYRIQVFEAPVTAASTPVRTITGIGPAVRQQVATGLTPGSYAFKVRAENEIGLGPVSDASNTVVVQDSTPTVSARTPASGATNVSVPSNVTVTFDRPVTGVTASTLRLRNLTTNALVATTVTLSANGLVATANPNPPLPNGTVIRVELVGGAGGIRSAADGTPIADQSWTFTTAVAPLVVTARTPAAGATRVNPSANVTATFNRPVQAANTTTVRLVNTRTGNVVNARVTVNTGGNRRVITLNPKANLARNTVFRVTLTGGASGIRDLSKVPFAGDTWTFRTRP